MIPAAFDYVRAGSAEEAISLLGEHGDEAKFLAGGHSLLPLMKLRLAQPSVLIDIGRLSDLSYIRDAGDHIAIGALTRHHDVETSDLLAEHVPLLDARRQPRRRPAGAPPRHDRRLDRPRRPGVRPAGDDAGARGDLRRPGPERHARDRRRRLLRELPDVRRSPTTSCSPRSGCRRCRAPAGASRSSTGGPRTGRSSASPPGAATATPASASSTWARPDPRHERGDGAGRWGVGRRRRRAGRRRGRPAGRPQRQRRVPHAPGQGAHPPRPRGRRLLTGPSRRDFAGGDQAYLRDVQYGDTANLDARTCLHARWSTAPVPWHTWLPRRVALARPAAPSSRSAAGPDRCGPQSAGELAGGRLRAHGPVGRDGGRRARPGRRRRLSTAVGAVTDVQSIPLPDAVADVVVANHMLYHVPDIPRAIDELARVLHPGGVALVSTNGADHIRELTAILLSTFADARPDEVSRFGRRVGRRPARPRPSPPSSGSVFDDEPRLRRSRRRARRT